MLSVRTRITVVASVLTAALLVAASLLLVAGLDRSLTRSSDHVSQARLEELRLDAARGALRARLPDAGNGVVQVVASDGRVVAASPNVRGRGPITAFRPPGDAAAVVMLRNAPDDNETESYRVWARDVVTPSGPATVYVGDSLESVHEATATLRHTLWTGVPLAVALLAAAAWVLVGRALRPVEAIRSEVAGITETDLGRRVPVPPADDEVARLARTMNGMLDRLEAARDREHEFVADASHELLSPLAATRATLEVGPRDGRWDDLVPGLLAENAGMERIVRDLLFLAREDRPPAERQPVDLDDVVLEEAARLRPLTGVRLETSGVSAGPVLGDREELRRLVRNLLENAVRHAGSAVRMRLQVEGDEVLLQVVDDGPGIDPEIGDRVFDRFYRGDPARARAAGGIGLGLAIARAVAVRHGGTLALAANDPGACVVLRLPVAASGPPGRGMPQPTG